MSKRFPCNIELRNRYFYLHSLFFLLLLSPLLGMERIGWAGNTPIKFSKELDKPYEQLSKMEKIQVTLRDKGYILEPFVPELWSHYYKVVVLNKPVGKEAEFLYQLDKDRLVLFLFEPRVVMPTIYNEKLHSHFSKIFTWDDDLVDDQTYFKLFYSHMRPMIKYPVPFQQKKFCCLFSTNLQSKVAGELYSERKKTIAFFETHPTGLFDFYGKGWESGEYRNYRGYVPDKINVLKQYKFNICYENSSQEKGYITEKIFHAFHAGVVPVYWGAPNVEEYIPKNCFIDRRDFSDHESLYSFLESVTEEQYATYIANIRNFLESEKAALFSPEHFIRLFCKEVTQ